MKYSYNTVLLLFTTSLLLFSCRKPISDLMVNDSSVETITLDVNEKSIKNLDDAFKTIKCVALETNDNNLIGQIDDVFFIDSTIIVVDEGIAKAVYLFDNSGKFKGRISFNGRGKHEYLQLTHVFRRGKSIAINDLIRREINFFDLNGKPIKTIKYKLPFNEVESLGDNYLACNIYRGNSKEFSNLNDYSFVILDDETDPVYAFGADNSNPDMILTRVKNLYSFDNHVYCTVNFDNVIYELTKDSAIAKYRLVMSPDLLKEVKFETTEEALEYTSENPFFFGFFTELKDYSVFGLSVPNEGLIHFVYDHKTKETRRLPLESQNPLFAFFSTPMFRNGDNTIVVPVNSDRILHYKEMLERAGIKIVFDDENLEKLTRESNPVLLYYEM